MALALPLAKLPKLPEKLPSAAPPPVGCRRAQPTYSVSAPVSRPKFGVAAPLALRAVTVALKLLPARIGPAVMLPRLKRSGAAMKLSLPLINRPVSAVAAPPV